ncbi:hypothetical protein [Streptomyces sp. bgisy153]
MAKRCQPCQVVRGQDGSAVPPPPSAVVLAGAVLWGVVAQFL